MSGNKAKEKRRLQAEEMKFREMAAKNGGRLVFSEADLRALMAGGKNGR